jgi:hypothetical protein
MTAVWRGGLDSYRRAYMHPPRPSPREKGAGTSDWILRPRAEARDTGGSAGMGHTRS